MSEQDLASEIERLWEERARLSSHDQNQNGARESVEAVLEALDAGRLRVAERDRTGRWQVRQWVKKAVLLSFRLHDSRLLPGGPGDPLLGASAWFDKVSPKCAGWDQARFQAAGFRAVPGAIVRRSAYVAPGVVLMPCFLNVGAYIDRGTMIDTWATVGSCAQIGRDCHISGGVGIGGVLEPLQANPVIIEDGVFIGARSEVAEGVIVREGAVVSMGVFLGASTRIVDRESGEVLQGEVPPYSVVVPGTLPGKPLADGSPGPALSCAVIVKRADARTRAKTSINELLRS